MTTIKRTCLPSRQPRIGRATAVRGLATNLPVRVAPTTVGAFYRLRWTIENLFRTLKSAGRLDELSSGKPAIVNVFISATLIGLAISQAICVLMRSERADQEPPSIASSRFCSITASSD